jgi:hypothetical protein
MPARFKVIFSEEFNLEVAASQDEPVVVAVALTEAESSVEVRSFC